MFTVASKLGYNLLGYNYYYTLKLTKKLFKIVGVIQIWMKKHDNMFEQTNK